mmetsp:Transcript_34537/g.55871  ORF Transcript_34537/g.55871 Transcript_34537/m.55871 type:complete len:219 (-) Transcript_34537:406-1062(-)
MFRHNDSLLHIPEYLADLKARINEIKVRLPLWIDRHERTDQIEYRKKVWARELATERSKERKAEKIVLVERKTNLETNPPSPPLLVPADPYLTEIQEILEAISAFDRKHIDSDALKRRMKSLGFKNSIDPLICRKVRYQGSNNSMDTLNSPDCTEGDTYYMYDGPDHGPSTSIPEEKLDFIQWFYKKNCTLRYLSPKLTLTFSSPSLALNCYQLRQPP